MKKTLALTVALLAVCWNLAAADISPWINFQGRLTNSSGAALPDQNYSVTITLYRDLAGTPAGWTDIFNTPTKNGYFNVVLGKDGNANPSLLNINYDRQLYIGIKVGTDPEMSPRQPLCSVPYALNASVQFSGFSVLTAASGTYVPSAGTRAILVECQGGGGGGGGATAGPDTIGVGAGGHGGGYCVKYIYPVADSYSYSIGSGGGGGAAGADGGAGGNTLFGSLLTATGGNGGGGGVAATAPRFFSTGGLQSVGTTGGDLNVNGETAGYAFALSLTMGTGGKGGNSRFGLGGTPGLSGFNGYNASGYGAGGGGACAIASVNRTGGAGTPGIIVISEYK